jgi:hypothetical protein
VSSLASLATLPKAHAQSAQLRPPKPSQTLPGALKRPMPQLRPPSAPARPTCRRQISATFTVQKHSDPYQSLQPCSDRSNTTDSIHALSPHGWMLQNFNMEVRQCEAEGKAAVLSKRQRTITLGAVSSRQRLYVLLRNPSSLHHWHGFSTALPPLDARRHFTAAGRSRPAPPLRPGAAGVSAHRPAAAATPGQTLPRAPPAPPAAARRGRSAPPGPAGPPPGGTPPGVGGGRCRQFCVHRFVTWAPRNELTWRRDRMTEASDHGCRLPTTCHIPPNCQGTITAWRQLQASSRAQATTPLP